MTFTDKEWAERCKGVGASEVAAIMGISPWQNVHSLWLQKTGREGPSEDTDYTQFGRVMEPVLIEQLKRRMPEWAHGDGSRYCAEEQVTFSQGEHEFATPDAALYSLDAARYLRVADMKTASEFKVDDWGADGSSDVPDYYAVQLQWQMYCAGVDCGDIMALVGRSFRLYHLDRDRDIVDLCRKHVAAFWRLVQLDIPPKPDGSEAARRTLEARFMTSQGQRTSTPQEDDLIEELAAVRENLGRFKSREELLRQRLCEAIGDHKTIVSSHGRVTWAQAKGRTTTDWKSVVSEAGVHDDLINKHTKTGKPSRRFLFKGHTNGK